MRKCCSINELIYTLLYTISASETSNKTFAEVVRYMCTVENFNLLNVPGGWVFVYNKMNVFWCWRGPAKNGYSLNCIFNVDDRVKWTCCSFHSMAAMSEVMLLKERVGSIIVCIAWWCYQKGRCSTARTWVVCMHAWVFWAVERKLSSLPYMGFHQWNTLPANFSKSSFDERLRIDACVISQRRCTSKNKLHLKL
jgi:hypothetical protein